MITVVMPVLNGMPYFEEALKSVQDQTLTDIEILVIDAGSTDGTVEYVKRCGEKDSRIKYIASTMKSMGHQYNLGILNGKGSYIAFCESDDTLESDALEQMYELFQLHPDLDYVKADFNMFFQYGEETFSIEYHLLPNGNRDLYGQILNASQYPQLFYRDVNMWNGLYKMDFLKQKSILLNETKGAAFQDAGFILQVHLLGEKAVVLNKPVYNYRRDNVNSSMYKPNTGFFCLNELRYGLEFLKKYGKENTWEFYTVFERLFGMFCNRYGKDNCYTEEVEYEEAVTDLRKYLLDYIDSLGDNTRMKLQNNLMLQLFLESIEVFRQVAIVDYKKGQKQLNDIYKRLCEEKEIVVFGIGENGKNLLACLSSNGLKHHMVFCDNQIKEQPITVLGRKAYAVEEAVRKWKEAVYLIPDSVFAREMKEQLLNYGIKEQRIVITPCIGTHFATEVNLTKEY